MGPFYYAEKRMETKIHPGGYDVYQGPRNLDPAIRSAAQWPVNEVSTAVCAHSFCTRLLTGQPLAVVPAMAAATQSIGIGVTVATTYEPPYHLARRLSTIDHLTKGRFGWNIVTGYLDSAARNLIGKDQPMHDNRCRYSIFDQDQEN